jgi:hypothetical protein
MPTPNPDPSIRPPIIAAPKPAAPLLAALVTKTKAAQTAQAAAAKTRPDPDAVETGRK